MKETTEVCISLSMSFLVSRQVMETKDMLYIVTEFAKNGEMFGKSLDLEVVALLLSVLCNVCSVYKSRLGVVSCQEASAAHGILQKASSRCF